MNFYVEVFSPEVSQIDKDKKKNLLKAFAKRHCLLMFGVHCNKFCVPVATIMFCSVR